MYALHLQCQLQCQWEIKCAGFKSTQACMNKHLSLYVKSFLEHTFFPVLYKLIESFKHHLILLGCTCKSLIHVQ